MSTQIVGGRRNNPLSIGADNRARVLCVNQSAEFNLALNELAFQILAEVDLTSSSLTPLMYIKNTITGYRSGQEQVMCLHDLVVSGDANLHFEMFTEESYTSGGTSVTPINKFIGSSRQASAVGYDNSSNDLVLGGDGTEFESFFIGANTVYKHSFGGSIILRNQKAITVKVQGANTNKARVALNFFYASLDWAE